MKRKQVKDFLTFANITIKIYYDNTYKIFYIIKRSIIHLRLYYKYKNFYFINYKFYN